jgi:hypothetical protein
MWVMTEMDQQILPELEGFSSYLRLLLLCKNYQLTKIIAWADGTLPTMNAQTWSPANFLAELFKSIL